MSAAIEIPPGWKLVPVEPTEEMITEGVGEWLGHGTKSLSAEWRIYIRKTWSAMLSAAPTQPKAEPSVADWQCSARKQSLPEPGDCGWPTCGCDPYAGKVIAAIQESLCGGALNSMIKVLREREFQMMGAAISRRDWQEIEAAYNAGRDRLDRDIIPSMFGGQ